MSDQSSQSHGPVVEPHDAHGHSGHDGAHSFQNVHHGGIAKYIYVFVALCFLTSLSFFTYSTWWRSHFSQGESDLMMMAVSCAKSALVILCFMHIWWEANWKFVLTIPAMFMSIFLMLMLIPDIGLRLRHASEERQFHMAQPVEPGPRNAEHPAVERNP
jgi:cytochrome c oxidase subunit IV